jgi:hypothetical protein
VWKTQGGIGIPECNEDMPRKSLNFQKTLKIFLYIIFETHGKPFKKKFEKIQNIKY